MKTRVQRARLKADQVRRNPDHNFAERLPGPLTNYSLSSVCPACGSKTYKFACKVRCPKCGFMWDCSEL